MTTATQTANAIATAALRKIGVIAIGQPATAEEMDVALKALDRMLKSWQAEGYNLWTKASQTVTLTTALSYTLNPVRPLRILSCRFKRTTGVELPMTEMTRDEYDTLPVKTTTGTPTMFHYNRQREAATLLIWPRLATAAGETLEITFEREIDDVVAGSALDVPGEWYDAVVYGLAARLTDDFMAQAPQVVARAEQLLSRALAFDREGSVYFGETF